MYKYTGPYAIRVSDKEIFIADTSEVNSGELQILKVDRKITTNFGYITKLARKAKRGDTEIYVEPFNWWIDAKNKGLDFPKSFPLTMRGFDGEWVGIELAEAIDYETPTWTCEPW